MRVKSFHSSQESLSPEHRGSVSAAGGNAHTGPPTEAPSGGGGGGVGGVGGGSLKPALPRLCAYTKSTSERMRGEREWEPARRGWGEQEKRRAEERGQAGGDGIRVGVKKKSKGEVVG